MATTIQSDKSIIGDTRKAKVVARQVGHRDLDLSLKIHPIRKDIIPLKDDNAIKNAIRNLLVSNFSDRPFQRDKGANLRALLFEPADVITTVAIKQNIRKVIAKYEPRVKLIKISVQNKADQNAYRIIVRFLIKEFDQADNVEIILRRLR
tara:strand:+ start:17754 stop:18203 length:450 start_codon:yes stop_codon:yes gene_type:complete